MCNNTISPVSKYCFPGGAELGISVFRISVSIASGGSLLGCLGGLPGPRFFLIAGD